MQLVLLQHGYQHATSRGARFGEAHRDHGRAGYEDNALAPALWADTGLDAAIAAVGLCALHPGDP
jgi:hypothetical protein